MAKINPKKEFSRPPKVRGHKAVVSYSLDANNNLARSVSYVPNKVARNSRYRLLRFQPKQYTYSVGSLLKAFFMLILLVSVVGSLTGTTNANITFYGLLDYIQRAPKIPTDWISFGGQFQGVPVIGWIISAVRVLMFFVVGLSQAILFLLYFLGFLFGVPV